VEGATRTCAVPCMPSGPPSGPPQEYTGLFQLIIPGGTASRTPVPPAVPPKGQPTLAPIQTVAERTQSIQTTIVKLVHPPISLNHPRILIPPSVRTRSTSGVHRFFVSISYSTPGACSFLEARSKFAAVRATSDVASLPLVERCGGRHMWRRLLERGLGGCATMYADVWSIRSLSKPWAT